MRSLILILGTLALLFGGFVVYWLMQPPGVGTAGGPRRGEAPVVRPLERGEHGGVIGAGEGAWVYQYNEKGRLASRFRAARYEPREAGIFGVTRPAAEFYLNDGQVLRIEGATGEVAIPDAELRPDTLAPAGTNAAPSRGELRDVMISLYESEADAEADVASLTIAVANAAFDNVTFQIHTESYEDETGQRVARDQVPVRVRSSDVDFDGRGLIIRWNELDQRLEYAEITHGERLELRNISAVSLPGVRREEGGRGTAFQTLQSDSENQEIPERAADQHGLKARATAEADGSQPSADGGIAAGVYRVTFNEDVRVMQAGEEVVGGDAMTIDFRLRRDQSLARRSEREAPEVPDTGHVETPEPHEAPREPGDELVFVHWSGKLTLTPAGEDVEVPPGEAVIGLVGTPLLLNQGDGHISAASLQYSTADSALQLVGSELHPLVLDDGRGVEIWTERVTWMPEARRATLHGRSRASIPLDDGEMLAAEWAELCTLILAEGAGRGLAISRAMLEKDVIVRHPNMDLDSQALEMDFDQDLAADSDRSRMQLRRLTAAGGAVCVLRDREDEPRQVAAEKLLLETAMTEGGRLYPRLVQAEGNVRTADGMQSLVGNEMELVLAPAETEAGEVEGDVARAGSAYGSVQVERMRAAGGVRWETAEGRSAEGEELIIEMREGHPHVQLTGEPARIADGENEVSGLKIDVDPGEQTASVRGAGALRMHHASSAEESPRVVDVNWTREAVIRGGEDLAEVIGEVVVRTDDSDGTTNVGRAGRVRIHLVNEELAGGESSEARGVHPPPAPPSREGGVVGGELNFLQGKVARVIEFLEGPRFEAELLAEDGSVLKRSALLAEEVIEYDVRQQRMVVRGPGRLLYEDRRPEEADEAVEEADAERPAGDRQPRMGQPGVTAFAWQKELIYDETTRRAVMDGDVLVVHEGVGERAMRFEIEAPTLTAEMEEGGTQVRRLLADRGLQFRSGGLQFDAAMVEFLAEEQTIVARGSEHYPARLYEEGLAAGTFQELRYNLETGALQITGGAGRVRPR